MNSAVLLLILLAYLALLFFAAQWAEKKGNSKWTNNAYVYTLSLAVYCTAWTYYGSIGTAAKSGLTYFPTYIGPIIIFPAWIYILKKIVRISRVNKISSIADFISLRYGNNRALGAVVTVITIVAIIPYIALQIKAISETFHVLTKTPDNSNVFLDTTTYVALVLAIFSSFYGTRYVDATEKRKGIVTVVALESTLKLFFFLILGIYVTFFVFDGFGDIYQRASLLEGFKEKNTIHGIEGAVNWYFYIMLAMFAIFLLPRQFHMAVVENNREKHIRTAIWLFPLYLLLFNLFVFPIAWGGNIMFDKELQLNADMYALMIPQAFGNDFLAMLVFLGGFSAAISMIVVASITLSTMLSNNLLIPYGFIGSLQAEQARNNRRIIRSRRLGIFMLIILSYLSYRYLMVNFSLVSVGMISFVFIAQLAPSFFGAIFWTRGSQKGAMTGLIIGTIICIYTLLVPYVIDVVFPANSIDENGPFGIMWLRPFHLFGMPVLEPIPHALFWSLFFNLVGFAVVSVSYKGDYRERNYAEMFVNIDSHIVNHENSFVWRGTAYISDIEKVLVRFLGEERTARALRIFRMKYNIDKDDTMADARLIKFAENLLTGHIGTASAKILIEGVSKEDRISLTEVLRILEESKENLITNRKLTETTQELRRLSNELELANTSLIHKDRQKDEFLDTVTHELRTPITAIRAASEILHDDDEIPEELRKQFLQNIMSESDRLNRLINKILDLEKFESGRQQLQKQEGDLRETVRLSAEPLMQLMANQNILFEVIGENVPVWANYDPELILQVVTNLLSNAIKFADAKNGNIRVSIDKTDALRIVSVYNNGINVNPEEMEAIFEKFYQSGNQNINKPIGSGLGLAISRQIAEMHKGSISVTNHSPNGVTFMLKIPA
ncbi:ATP-binding protein [Flavobacterium silvaticum]|uniref:histidine kinase n=1 Tax=Flavobacterium silvaticum TaxID=1852020 RepID=A0A972FVW0_9FLAO|nr:ATP-binding protein [Flavobacterium silvaticum]NMH28987.1 sodium:proline symporter [Flavobacterium silvaticum]